MTIETITESNFEDVLPLVADYQVFYKALPDPERNRRHFSAFLKSHARGVQFLARDSAGVAVGFATLYKNFSSVSAAGICVLNDLYTVPSARGKGVGRALIEHSRAYARSHGYASLAWFTAADNHDAQVLYNKFKDATQKIWLRYALPTGT